MNVAEMLDPEIAERLKSMPQMDGFAFEDLPRMRAERNAPLANIQLSDRVERREYRVPGAPGDPEVAIRVHRPKGVSGDLPCLYFMHGGGFVVGTYLQDDLRFDQWCVQLQCVGVSVEYRLAPETPYPGPMEDAYAGLKWVIANAGMLGIDVTRLGIGGGSAGAGLAAGLALLVRDRKEFEIVFQLLIYPMIDDRMTSVSSHWDVPIWTRKSNDAGWRAYLGKLRGGDVPIYAAPSRAADLSGLPPAYIMVGALDGFLDEDIDYAQRLTHAGVPVEFHLYPGGPHGFDALLPGTRLARRGRADMEAWLARQFAR